MVDDVKTTPVAKPALAGVQVEKEVSWLGARLREKSTYAGMAVVVSLALPVLAKYVPSLAGADATQIVGYFSAIGIALGGLIAIFVPDKGAKVVIALLAIGLTAAGMTLPSPAAAQTRAASTRAASSVIEQKIQQFEKVTIADLSAAKQIFDAAKNANGSSCTAAWLSLAQANAAIDETKLPQPHVFATLAKAYNLAVALESGSPLRVACAAMKDDINSNSLLGGAGILGGVGAVSKLVPAFALLGL